MNLEEFNIKINLIRYKFLVTRLKVLIYIMFLAILIIEQKVIEFISKLFRKDKQNLIIEILSL